VEPGLADPGEFVRGTCLAPGLIDAMVDRSLSNLGLEVIDCYYVRPGAPADRALPAAVYDALEATFEMLERRVAAGDSGRYGVATWAAFRALPERDIRLSLPELIARARSAADAVGRRTAGLGAI